MIINRIPSKVAILRRTMFIPIPSRGEDFEIPSEKKYSNRIFFQFVGERIEKLLSESKSSCEDQKECGKKKK